MSWHLVTRGKRVKRLAMIILSCLPSMHLEVLITYSLKRVRAFVPDPFLFRKCWFFEALREENERGVCFVYDYITAEYYLLVYGFSSMTKRCVFGILINNNIC